MATTQAISRIKPSAASEASSISRCLSEHAGANERMRRFVPKAPWPNALPAFQSCLKLHPVGLCPSRHPRLSERLVARPGDHPHRHCQVLSSAARRAGLEASSRRSAIIGPDEEPGRTKCSSLCPDSMRVRNGGPGKIPSRRRRPSIRSGKSSPPTDGRPRRTTSTIRSPASPVASSWCACARRAASDSLNDHAGDGEAVADR